MGDANAGIQPRVLIVEDEGLLALDMEMTLSTSGFRVVGQVDTERRAVEAADREDPDIVLMDITLASGSGIAAAKTILNKRPVCVIFVSGNSDPRTQADAESLSPAGFIRKPYNAQQLPLLVSEAYGRFRTARA